MRHLWTSP
jgi:17beta-estradiol 17-dehydrogenase / very-long-chain 3-oxoacyl-CoA reductase